MRGERAIQKGTGRHCEERSDEAIQGRVCGPGLLRFASLAMTGEFYNRRSSQTLWMRAGIRTANPFPPHWNVMSRHFEMSEPRPEEMMMQPRTFCAVVSAAQIE